jgi:hypothetical protein
MNVMNNIQETCEAVLIVEGLSILINRTENEFCNHPDKELYQATIGFMKFVHGKYHDLAARKMKKDPSGNYVPMVVSPQDIIRSAAEKNILQSLN